MSDPTITIRKGRFKKPCTTTYTNYSIRADNEKKIDLVNLMQGLTNLYQNKRILKDYFLPPMSQGVTSVSAWVDIVEAQKKASQPMGTVEYEFDYISKVQVLPSPQQVKDLGFKKGKEEKRANETYITTPPECDPCDANPFTINHSSLKWYDSTAPQPPGYQNIPATFNVSFLVHYKFKQRVNSKTDPTPYSFPHSPVGPWSPTLTKPEVRNVSGFIGSTLWVMFRDVETTSDQCECYL